MSTRGADGTVAVGQAASASGVAELDAPAVAMDPTGDATLLWTRILGGRSIVERASTTTP